jgi:hypothetical protein
MAARLLWLAWLALSALCGCGTPDHLPEYSNPSQAGGSASAAIKTSDGEALIVSLEPFAR